MKIFFLTWILHSEIPHYHFGMYCRFLSHFFFVYYSPTYEFPHFHNSLTTTLPRKWSLQYGADWILRASFSPALQPWVALSSPIFQISGHNTVFNMAETGAQVGKEIRFNIYRTSSTTCCCCYLVSRDVCFKSPCNVQIWSTKHVCWGSQVLWKTLLSFINQKPW